MATVYLLHLTKPMCHARHYIGWAQDLENRLDHHRNGTGARMLQVAEERGIDFDLVRTWEDQDKTFERRLKNQHNAPRLCPICNPGNHDMEKY